MLSSASLGRVAQIVERSEEFIGTVGEERLGTLRGEAHVRRVVEAAGFDGAALGEFVDDQLDEADLVGRVALVVEPKVLQGRAVRRRSAWRVVLRGLSVSGTDLLCDAMPGRDRAYLGRRPGVRAF